MPVKCRKCGGDHFTSKCGKEKKPEVSKNNDSNHNDSNHNDSNRNDSNHNDSKKTFDVKNKKRSRFRKPFDSSSNVKTFKVKINNLPHDLTLHNLNKMMVGWGRIGDIRLRQDRTTSYALIDFFDMLMKQDYPDVWLDFRLGILSKYKFGEYNVLDKNLTFYRQIDSSASSKFSYLSKNWWLRRKQAHDYVEYFFNKNNLKYKKNLDCYLTKIFYEILK